MTFAQYIQGLGVLLAQWLPICGLMYLAVRKGVEHGVKVSATHIAWATDKANRSTALDYERDKISKP